MPSNTLATLYGLATDCGERNVLGPDVEIRLSELDETNKRVRVGKYVRRIRRDGDSGLVALVGVQSNQFPRAMELARQFRTHGLQVCLGGFHVSADNPQILRFRRFRRVFKANTGDDASS